MVISKKSGFLFFFVLLIYILCVNLYNVHIIKKNNPKNIEDNCKSLVYNSTIYSVDNYWYVHQMKNFINGKGFTIDPNKAHYDVRRTPVYPLFYGIHYLAFGEDGSYKYIRVTQILLFILATFALLQAAYHFTQKKSIAIITACLFGFNPLFVVYLFYTITEGISPALMCFMLYFISLGYRYNRKKDWFFAGLFFALGCLCRPAIFFLAPSFLFLIVYKNRKKVNDIIIYSLFSFFGAAVLFAPHVIRNYCVSKDFILLEKYYGDPMDYGMPNIALRYWITCWINPADYTSEAISNKMLQNINNSTSSIPKSVLIEQELERLPKQAFLANSRDEIKDAYGSLYDYYNIKLSGISTKKSIDSSEAIAQQKMEHLRNKFIQNKPFQFYIIRPMLFLKSLILQSNSYILIFLDDYQNNIVKWIAKLVLYLLNIYLFAALFLALIFIKKYKPVTIFAFLFLFLHLIYLIFIIEYFEARYLIPIFPLMYIVAGIFTVECLGKIKAKLNF